MDNKTFNWQGLLIAAVVTIAILGSIALSFGPTPASPAKSSTPAQTVAR